MGTHLSIIESWRGYDEPPTTSTSKLLFFFSSTGDLAHLNKAILYVRDNEQTQILKIVHVYEDESKIPLNIEENVKILDKCYPKMRIDFVGVKGTFSPDIIDYVSKTLNVPKNLMFIACPGKGFSTQHRYSRWSSCHHYVYC